jgi:hypothetical protein
LSQAWQHEPPVEFETRHPGFRRPLAQAVSTPVLLGLVGVGLTLVVLVAGLGYAALVGRLGARDAGRRSTELSGRMTVVVPEASASGTMRGAKWQIVPGAFGGFSSGASHDSY